MARTQRAQILMEPEEYRRLQSLARREKTSVGELVRRAVHECYFTSPADRRRAVEEIVSLELPLANWDEMEQEILEGRGAILS